MTSRALAALIDTVHGLREEVEGLKAPQLGHSSLEDASLLSYRGDQLSAQVGTLYDGSSGIAVLAGPAPPTPSWTPEGVDPLPPGQAVAGGYVFRWSGKWVDLPAVPPDTVATPQIAPADFSRVELHVSTAAVFSAMTFDTMVSSSSSSRGSTWFIKADDFTPRYACLVARTTSGRVSARSEIIGPFVAGKIEQDMLNLDLGQIGGVDSFAGPDTPTTTKVGSLWLREPDDRLHRYDGTAWVPYQDADVQAAIVAAANAAQAASNAQGTADNALTLAGEAGGTADLALTAANGKTKVIFSAVNPTVGALTPGALGDVWYRRDAQGWIRAIYEHMGATGDTATQGWRFRQLTDQVLGSLTAGKITTGTLDAAARITIGSPTGNRLVLDGSVGIQGIQRVNNVDIVNFGFDISTGNGSLRGLFQTLDVNERAVIISSNIQSAGGGVAQPGILFKNPTLVNRWAQIYSTNSDLHMDGPAYVDINGVSHQGVSLRLNIDSLLGYTASASGLPTFQIHNDGSWWMGDRGPNPSSQTTVYGNNAEWWLGNQGAGTRLFGNNTGYWTIGDINTMKSRIVGTGTSVEILNGTAATEMRLPDTGEWFIGHKVGQAIYSVGNKMVFRDRQIAGPDQGGIQMFTSPGNWFDVYPSDDGGNQGGMFVHGRFGAANKNFIIDHPVDPERRLVHGCTESPAAGVEYYGMAQLDRKGEAVVELPSYFEALTYPEGRAILVTAVGRPAPVGADEIVDGRFTVYGQNNGKVSWLVKANRRGVDFEVEPMKDGQFAPVAPDSPPIADADQEPQMPRPKHKKEPDAGGKHGEPV